MRGSWSTLPGMMFAITNWHMRERREEKSPSQREVWAKFSAVCRKSWRNLCTCKAYLEAVTISDAHKPGFLIVHGIGDDRGPMKMVSGRELETVISTRAAAGVYGCEYIESLRQNITRKYTSLCMPCSIGTSRSRTAR